MRAADKQANRRIRLLLALFVLVFAARSARAVWLQGVRRCARSAAWRSASTARRSTIPAGRGTIFDRTGVQLAIGEQTTTVYADPQQVTQRRARSRSRRTAILGVDANALYPQLLDKKSQLRLRAALRRSRRPQRSSSQKGFAGVGSYPEERRAYPQGTRRLRR